MRSRLSAWKYVRNNKRQVWVMIIALSLTFMTMYLINFMLLTTEESFKGVFFEMPKKLAVMNFDWKTLGVDPEAPGTDEEKAEAMRTARQKLTTHRRFPSVTQVSSERSGLISRFFPRNRYRRIWIIWGQS